MPSGSRGRPLLSHKAFDMSLIGIDITYRAFLNYETAKENRNVAELRDGRHPARYGKRSGFVYKRR